MPPSNETVDGILQEMNSDDWQERSRAFYDLANLGVGDRSFVAVPVNELLKRTPGRAEQIKLALIRLLEKENLTVESYAKADKHFGEDYSNYYADIISVVSSLKDIKSMNALLGAITTGGMATRSLAEFAPVSLDPVLAKLKHEDPTVRASALQVLQDMLAPANFPKVKDPSHLSRIKQAFLMGVRDPDGSTRSVAVRCLVTLGDPDAIPVIADLAEHDPAYLPRPGGKKFYFVREHAVKALAELRLKAKQHP
jgi:HEAT repeat protein